jgi:hypothetical protein
MRWMAGVGTYPRRRGGMTQGLSGEIDLGLVPSANWLLCAQ